MNSPANRPTIGFLCGGNAWGGLEMNVLRLAEWLRDRGWSIILYTEPTSPLYEHAAKQNFVTRPINSRSKYRGLFSAPKLATQIKQDGVDVLVLHTNRQLLLAVLAKLLSGNRFKLVYQQHMHIGGSKTDLFHRWEYGKIDSWIAPLEMFASRVSKQTPMPAEKVVVIPFGVEIKKFTDRTFSRAAARETLSLPPDELIVGVVGRIDRLKGQDILIKAVSELHQNGLKAHILIMGDSTHQEGEQFATHLRSLTKELALSDFVHFRPHREDVAVAYHAIDIFAMTTYSETYGMVTIEAMAAGLPVVGSNDGGTMEIIKPGLTGFLVEPGNPASLAAALLKIGRDPELRKKLGAEAAIEASRNYSHLFQCERFENLMHRLSGEA